MQLRAGVRGSGEASAAKTRCRHSEVASVFLHQNIGRRFRRAEKRVLRVIDAHRLGNPGLVFVAGLDLPLVHPPIDQDWLWREARLADPSGNIICIYRAGENRRFPPWRIGPSKAS